MTSEVTPDLFDGDDLNEEGTQCRKKVDNLQVEMEKRSIDEEYRLRELKSIEKDLRTELQVTALHGKQIQELLLQLQNIKAIIATSHSSHSQSICKLLESYKNAVDVMSSSYAQSVQTFADFVARESEAAVNPHRRLCQEIESEILKSRNTHQMNQDALNKYFNSQKKHIQDLWDERNGVARLLGEESIRVVAAALDDESKKHEADTGPDKQKYEKLLQQDNVDSKTMEQNERRLHKLKSEILEWKKKLAVDAITWQDDAEATKEMKKKALEEYSKLQHTIECARKTHEENLKSISLSRYVMQI